MFHDINSKVFLQILLMWMFFLKMIWHVSFMRRMLSFCFSGSSTIKLAFPFLSPAQQWFIMYPTIILIPEIELSLPVPLIIILIKYYTFFRSEMIRIWTSAKADIGTDSVILILFMYFQACIQMKVHIDCNACPYDCMKMLPPSFHWLFFFIYDVHVEPRRKELLERSIIVFRMNTTCRHYFL